MKLYENGFTLIEVIISIAIISITGLLLVTIVINSTNVSFNQALKIEQGLDINNALSQVKTKIKQSTGVLSYYPNSQSPIFTTSSTQLILNLPAIDSSEQIITGHFDVFVFLQDGIYFKMKSFPDLLSNRKASDQLLSNKINTLEIKYYDNSTPPQEVSPSAASKIKMTVGLKQKNGFQDEISIATVEANLRN